MVPATLAERLIRRFTATSAETGLSVTATTLTTPIDADAVFVESARLAATSVTGFAGGRETGAVKVAVFAPVLETVPQFPPLHPEPVTVHVTDWFEVKQTEAVKLCCPPSATVAAVGEMETACEHEAVIAIEAEADWLVSAALIATSVTGFAGGREAGAV